MDWLTGVTTRRKSPSPPPIQPPPLPAPRSQKKRVTVVVEDEDVPSTTTPSFSSPFPFTTPHLPHPIRPVVPRRPYLNLGPSPVRLPVLETHRIEEGPVSIPYYSITLPDYGIYSVATPSTYGGLQYDSYGPKATLVSQYNLASFWRRPGVGGVEGRIRPLLGVRKDHGALKHLPGFPNYCKYMKEDREDGDRRGRNLMAASKRREGEKRVEIWTVNERSRRKKLERLTMKTKKDGGLRRVKIEEDMTVDGVIIELRRVEWSEGAVWVRRKGGALSIVSRDEGGGELSQLEMENGAVKEWSESVWMDGEMAILMDDGTLKHGTIEIMKEVKTGNIAIETVTHTDHPRVLVIGSAHECSLLDLREKMKTRVFNHFRVPPLTSGGEKDHYLIPRHKEEETIPRIRHLKTMRESPRNTIVVTDVGVYVVDERCNERALLSTSHPMHGGGDGLWYGGRRREDGGRTHTLTMVDHRREEWMEWQIYEGGGGGLSGVSPWKKMRDVEGKKTRGVCYVETREGRSARVRQVDDGSIHYEVIGEEGWKEEEEEEVMEGGGEWEEEIREEWKGGRREGMIVDARVRGEIEEKRTKMRIKELREWIEKEEKSEDEEEKGREDVKELLEEWKEEMSEKWMIGRGLKKVFEYHKEEMGNGVEGEEEEDEYVEWAIPPDEKLEETLEWRKRRKEELMKEREGEQRRKRMETVEQEMGEEMTMDEDGMVSMEGEREGIVPSLDEAVGSVSIEKKKERVEDEITAGIDWLNF
ncbi:hypothetical protein PMAYCL1PPCAC_07278 [Pristionchus mayeri]|uniref:Uncharacterized protein n=1 Tax=Pristionchus mayeri TaxID=1317129 RepID=A0AAN5C4K6_9BILA|nr:hypothetical protein PMAYCL1PPCAC_07278 [Pristionchus mayeri]